MRGEARADQDIAAAVDLDPGGFIVEESCALQPDREAPRDPASIAIPLDKLMVAAVGDRLLQHRRKVTAFDAALARVARIDGVRQIRWADETSCADLRCRECQGSR